jgi:hypothetical protein
MKKISILLAVSICFTLLGCGETKSAETGSETGISVGTIESATESESLSETDEAKTDEPESDEAETNESETSDSETHFTEALDDEGTYWISGYLLASNKDSAGEPDENGVLQAIIYEAYIEDDFLTIKGVTNFRNEESQDPVGMNEGDEAGFIITDQTVFQMVGGDIGPEVVTKEEFAQYLKDCADTGLLLDIQVNGAQVVVAQICS